MKKKVTKDDVVIKKFTTVKTLQAKLDEATKLMNSLQDQVITRDVQIAHLNNVIQRLESQVKDLLNPPPPVYPKPVGYSGGSKAKVYWKVGV